MSDDIFSTIYKPDVLSCLADLSNDEVFTPPNVVNEMLDMLPQELFESPDTTFLDPACKSGVFLREIAKRLIRGLENKIPDLQQRLDLIFHKQLFAIAITGLTSLLSRRSVYCSKYPNGEYSVSKFDNIQGNILFRNVEHEWIKGKCCFCGANEAEYHFGAWRDNAKKLFEKEGDDDESYDSFDAEEYAKNELGNAINETWLPITSKHYLYLSGTPFRALNNGEFVEDQIYSWTYTDEQREKENWQGNNNPYAELPRMVMMTYKIPDSM